MAQGNRAGSRQWYVGAMAIVLFLAIGLTRGQNVVSVKEIKPDKACGPRCLVTLVRITGVGPQDCDVKGVYDLIGKRPFSVTTLKDLKDAAEQLGFRAQGHRFGIAELRKVKGYAVLPIGSTAGTALAPLHFILVKRLTAEHAIMVDPQSLASKALLLSDLQKVWSGYALVLSSRDAKRPLPKPPDDPNTAYPASPDSSPRYEELWDFGMADHGAVVEHTFLVHRAADGPRQFKFLGKSCTCLDAKLGQDTAGNTTLTVKLHVKNPAWQTAEARIAPEPSGPVKAYAVKVFGRSAFRVEPRQGYIEVAAGGTTEYPVRVSYYADVNDLVAFNRFRSSVPEVEASPAELQRTFPDPSHPDTVVYILDAPLICRGEIPADGPAVRTVVGTVEFVFDTNKGERTIPLDLTLKVGAERVRLSPEKVFLMVTRSGAAVEKKVKLEFLAKPYPTSVSVQVDEGLPLRADCTRLADGRYMVSVITVPDKLRNSPDRVRKGTITLVCEGHSEPLQVPVSLFVRE